MLLVLALLVATLLVLLQYLFFIYIWYIFYLYFIFYFYQYIYLHTLLFLLLNLIHPQDVTFVLSCKFLQRCNQLLVSPSLPIRFSSLIYYLCIMYLFYILY